MSEWAGYHWDRAWDNQVHRGRLTQAWAYLTDCASRGHTPSLRKIARAIGLETTSVSYVFDLINELVAYGYIEKGPRNSQGTIKVLIPLVKPEESNA